MSKPAHFSILETNNLNEALSFIDFSIKKIPIYYKDKEDRLITIFQQLIVKENDFTPFQIVSPSYESITHGEVFLQTIDGFEKEKIPFELKSIAIEKNGAKMMARFQILKDYLILPGKMGEPDDYIRPEIVLVNSYDGGIGLGLDLGSFRKIGLIQMRGFDYIFKWIHFGKKKISEKVSLSIKEALKTFEEKIINHYKDMTAKEISKEKCIEILCYAGKKDLIPIKTAKLATQNVMRDYDLQHGKRSIWTLFNVFCGAATHLMVKINYGEPVSPSRVREIFKNISKLFKNDDFLDFKMTEEQIAVWIHDSDFYENKYFKN